MGDDLAAANVNRSYQLAASSIAIFTFLTLLLKVHDGVRWKRSLSS